MSTPHNEANKEDIAENVIMPGDPLRAKYIAENYLENAKLINQVRNMLGYTGTYKGKRVTVFGSGMGMPSMGIYCYELYKFYDVQNIIRIGTCGALKPELELFDNILVEKSYTVGNFSKALNHKEKHLIEASEELNERIENTAKAENIKIVKGNAICNEFFDVYDDEFEEFLQTLPQDLNLMAAEMESFSLFYTAKYLERNAACILSVVDSKYKNAEATTDEREKSLDTMIKLALDSI